MSENPVDWNEPYLLEVFALGLMVAKPSLLSQVRTEDFRFPEIRMLIEELRLCQSAPKGQPREATDLRSFLASLGAPDGLGYGVAKSVFEGVRNNSEFGMAVEFACELAALSKKAGYGDKKRFNERLRQMASEVESKKKLNRESQGGQ